MGLSVDAPKPGFGTINGGNTAGAFFWNPVIASSITRIGEILIRKLHVVLTTKACGTRYNSKDSSDIEEMTAYLTYDKKWETWKADGYAGKWASYIYIVNCTKKEIVHKLELEQDDAALRLCLYKQTSKKYHIFVGVTRNMDLTFNSCRSASIHAYRVNKEFTSLKLLHKNHVNGIPTAFCTFKKDLLVGIGCELHFFQYNPRWGTLKLKCKVKCVPDRIHSIYLVGDIIMVAGAEESICYLMYDKKNNCFCTVGKSKTMTALSSACVLGKNLVARACKSGNIFIVQLHIIKNIEELDLKPPTNLSVVFTLTTLTRPSLPGNTSRICPIGQFKVLVLGSFKRMYTPPSMSLKMTEVFCAPTIPELISQVLNEFPPGMIR
ncbi:spliceosomal protein sap [Trichonephila inaurata madagascariensis]|uniref:Spliceosomal protein sap n=1 Tax=Trichonephila inaurata madagascariensis TaxID=2747483 RepID=A0A8X6IA75_9ARAC|nr:spliceosomal protein sap [Trichonephila inaurata madagascariensis]